MWRLHYHQSNNFFNRHDSHFNCRTLSYMEDQNTKHFVLKAGEYGNYHPNEDVTNAKLKFFYNDVKSSWMLKYGTNFFTSPHELNIGEIVGCL